MLGDLPAAVAMFNACARETSDKDEFDLEDYRNEWSDPSIDLAADTRIDQTPDGDIVGRRPGLVHHPSPSRRNAQCHCALGTRCQTGHR